MSEAELILLPGMDGTGTLFAPFVRVLPQSWHRRVVAYPADRVLTCEQLLDVIAAAIDGDRPIVLVGESFSGPLALRFAEQHPQRVRAVVLSTSFVRRPALSWMHWLARPVLMRLPVPESLIRFALLNRRCPASVVRMVASAVRQVAPEVLADRLRQIWKTDCTSALANCPAPILYLRAKQDRLIGQAAVKTILRIRPDAEVRSVPGPHLLLQAAPEEAWSEIRAFLEKNGIR